MRLYRATDFPHEWEMVKELYRGRASTPLPGDTKVGWFWTTLRELRSGALALMLFYADALDGTWTSHPQNPISMDVRNARSAGSIFSEDDRIPAHQDCSRTYGYGFTLFEIITLRRRSTRSGLSSRWDPTGIRAVRDAPYYNWSGRIEAPTANSRSAVGCGDEGAATDCRVAKTCSRTATGPFG